MDTTNDDDDIQPPVLERSVPLPDGVWNPEIPIRYQIVQKGSQRGQKLLVDSLGYSYGVKVN